MEEYDVNAREFRPELTRIKAAGPEGMIVYGAEPAGAMAIGQARGLGMDIPIIVSAGIVAPGHRAVKELAEGLEGTYVSGYKADLWETLPDTDPQKKVNSQLAQMLEAKYNRRLSLWEADAYDSLTLMVNAIKAANPDPTKVEEGRAKIRDALESGTKNYVGALVLIDAYTPTEHEGYTDPRMKLLQQVKKGEIVVGK